jgi:hypothetical protein
MDVFTFVAGQHDQVMMICFDIRPLDINYTCIHSFVEGFERICAISSEMEWNHFMFRIKFYKSNGVHAATSFKMMSQL